MLFLASLAISGCSFESDANSSGERKLEITGNKKVAIAGAQNVSVEVNACLQNMNDFNLRQCLLKVVKDCAQTADNSHRCFYNVGIKTFDSYNALKPDKGNALGSFSDFHLALIGQCAEVADMEPNKAARYVVHAECLFEIRTSLILAFEPLAARE